MKCYAFGYGSFGQVLVKSHSVDYDRDWVLCSDFNGLSFWWVEDGTINRSLCEYGIRLQSQQR
jgi:hypothetical protein